MIYEVATRQSIMMTLLNFLNVVQRSFQGKKGRGPLKRMLILLSLFKSMGLKNGHQ